MWYNMCVHGLVIMAKYSLLLDEVLSPWSITDNIPKNTLAHCTLHTASTMRWGWCIAHVSPAAPVPTPLCMEVSI